MNPVSDVCVEVCVLTHLLPSLVPQAQERIVQSVPPVLVSLVIMETTSSSEREPVTTTAIPQTCFSQLDFSTAARAHLIEGE